MNAMDRFEEQRQALIKERNELSARLQDNGSYGLDHAMNDAISELSGYDQHPADLGSEMYERAKDFSLREHDLFRLEQVETALSHFASGTYGTCDVCQQPIERLRLEAEPAATLCIQCEQKKDGPTRPHDRPIEEELLYPPFARTNMDDLDQTGFDGEDSWQAVAAMNNRHGDPESGIDDELYYEGGGYVDPLDRVSNTDYKAQLPD